MNRKSRLRMSFILLASVSLIAFTGCKRHEAMERVTGALNPIFVEISNEQSAVIDLNNGYAVIVPDYVRYDEIRYKVFFSPDGDFQKGEVPFYEGVSPAEEKVILDDVAILIGRTAEDEITGVVLIDQINATTGIGLVQTVDLESIDVSKIEFLRKKPLNSEDILPSFGLDTNSPN